MPLRAIPHFCLSTNAVAMQRIIRIWIFLCLALGAAQLAAQASVTVEVSADTVLPGSIVTVTYKVENGQGRITLPDMTGLPVVSGPNSSSSFLYQGGQMKSMQSYSYRLLAGEEGVLVVPATTYEDGEQVLAIRAVEITVSREARAGKPSTRRVEPGVEKPVPMREKRKF